MRRAAVQSRSAKQIAKPAGKLTRMEKLIRGSFAEAGRKIHRGVETPAIRRSECDTGPRRAKLARTGEAKAAERSMTDVRKVVGVTPWTPPVNT